GRGLSLIVRGVRRRLSPGPGRAASRLQPLDGPAAAGRRVAPAVDQAIVEAAGASLPELDQLGAQAIAAPVLGHRHLSPGETLARRGHGGLELGAAGDRRALSRRPRARVLLDDPLDPHLAVAGRPVETQRRARIGGELARLAAAVVGEEDEAAFVVAL